MIDHCISAFRKKQEKERLNVYITDALYSIVENTFHFAGGYEMRSRYIESTAPEEKPQETAEDIIQRITNNLTGIS